MRGRRDREQERHITCLSSQQHQELGGARQRRGATAVHHCRDRGPCAAHHLGRRARRSSGTGASHSGDPRCREPRRHQWPSSGQTSNAHRHGSGPAPRPFRQVGAVQDWSVGTAAAHCRASDQPFSSLPNLPLTGV